MRNTIRIAVLVTIIVLLAFPLGTFAAAGTGDGSGGGKLQPLMITNALPADGATGVEMEVGPESKSGVNLGQKTTLSFRTTGTAATKTANQPPADSAAAAKLPESLGEENNEGNLPGTIESDQDMNEAALQQNGQNTAAQEQKRQKRIIIDIIVAIIAGSAAWWFYRKWRHP